MRILYVVSFGSIVSGAVKVALDVANELKKIGHTVGILDSSFYRRKNKPLIPSGVQFFKNDSRFSQVSMILDYNKCKIPKFGEPVKFPDIVHFHGVYNIFHVKCAQKCREIGIPYIITLHGNLIKEAINYHKYRKLIAINILILKYLKGASVIHALGEKEAKDALFIIPEAKIVIIPNGINDEYLDFVSSINSTNNGTSLESFIFLFLGRLDVHHKGLDLLLESISKIASDFRRNNAKLLLTGPFNSQRDRTMILNFISRFQLNDIVIITGPKYGKDKINTLSSCDVFVHTSRYEGMPMAILEAMSFAKPCIITPNTNIAEYIKKTNSGWITKPNPNSIAKKIKNVLKTSYYERKKIGDNAKNLVNEQFKLSKTISSISALYSSIIKK